MLHHSRSTAKSGVNLTQLIDRLSHTRHHEVIAVPSPRRRCLTKSYRFSLALPKPPVLMDISDIPPPPSPGVRQQAVPSSEEATPEPINYYVPQPAGPGYDYTPIQDRRAVFSDHERKLAKAEARRKAGKSSKKGPKKTAAEKKAASEEKAAGKKREQEVYNLFWGISEPDA